MKHLVKVILMSTVSLFLGSSITYAQDKVEVVTTFYPVYFLTQQIAGDYAEVNMLLENNQDAHSYESSARDAMLVQESDLLIYQDDEMEFFIKDLLSIIDTSQTVILESTQGIKLLSSDQTIEAADHDDHDEEHTNSAHTHDYDPHTWLSPMIYAQQAENIKNALIEVDPDNQMHYESSTQALVDELLLLDQEFTEKLANRTEKSFVVQHAAFAYLAAEYGLQQIAITGLSTSVEPSAQQIAQMQQLIQEQEVSEIYVDPSMDASIAETVAQATGAELKNLRTIEVISQEEIAVGEDYFSLMRANLEALMP